MKKSVKKTTEKYLTENKFQKFEKTFEGSMRSIAGSFARVDASTEEHQKVMQLMLKEIIAIRDDNKYFRENILSLNTDGSSYDRRIDNLNMRVEKLESKIK